jgi:CheY-like chemotaxis protein
MTSHLHANQDELPVPYRVLIIDDDAVIRTVLRRQLEHAGYVVNDAPNGQVGLAASCHQPPDIVVTDIFMPEKDGIEVIQEIRSSWSKCRIIAMTGGSPVDPLGSIVNPAAILLGADKILLKPFDQQTLLSTIKDTLLLNNARKPS